MNSSRHTVILVVAMLAATGCATASRQVWTRPGAGTDDLARDRYACIQESRVQYDMSFSGGARAGFAQGGSDGGFVALGGVRRAQSEANRLFDACMEARGWR
jgi:hypothetical protein